MLGRPLDLEAWSAAHPDRRAAFVAGRQHGAIAAVQLRAVGLKRGAIGRRTDRRLLHRLHRGVWGWGHDAISPPGHLMAAVLAGGDGAVLSHQTAGALHRVIPSMIAGDVHITTRGGAGRETDGIAAHRAKLPLADTVWIDGLPATGLHRTLLDLGDGGDRRLVADAFHEAQVLQTLRPAGLRDLLDRSPGRHGQRILRDLLAAGEAPIISRSDLERRMRALIKDANLPQPVSEAPLHGYRADFLWPDQRLVVEVDGLRYHETDRVKVRDRRKDRALTLAGYLVLRYDWADVTTRPVLVAAELAGALAGAGR